MDEVIFEVAVLIVDAPEIEISRESKEQGNYDRREATEGTLY